jgi:hypothetical protein
MFFPEIDPDLMTLSLLLHFSAGPPNKPIELTSLRFFPTFSSLSLICPSTRFLPSAPLLQIVLDGGGKNGQDVHFRPDEF